jgi:septal ring factor EnvC (AmiA/AmiB activator)
MSSDPSQNSALAQDLANVDTQAQSLQANLESTLASAGTQLTQQAHSLLQSGMSATRLSAQIPLLVQQLNSQINRSTSRRLSRFRALHRRLVAAHQAGHSRSFQHKRHIGLGHAQQNKVTCELYPLGRSFGPLFLQSETLREPVQIIRNSQCKQFHAGISYR